MRTKLWAVAFCLFIGALNLTVDAITLDAVDAGFVTVAGGSAKGDGTVAPGATYNYSVGFEAHFIDGALGSPTAPMPRKNYFVFDLTGIATPIASATVKVYAGPDIPPAFPGGTHGYESLDPTEMFVFKETTAMGAALADIMMLSSSTSPMDFDDGTDPLVGVAAALYTKLGDGPMILGGAVVSPGDDGTTLSITLDPLSMPYLNSFLGGKVALAGVLPTAVPPASPQEIFGFTGPSIPLGDPLTPELELTLVPEPSAVSVTLMLLSAACCRRSRSRAGGSTSFSMVGGN